MNKFIKLNLTVKLRRGFTLIELLIVIAVLGVLATVVIIIINPLQQFAKARDAGRISDITQIANALQAYYTINGKYPDNDSTGQTQSQAAPANCGWGGSLWNAGTTLLPLGHNFLQDLVTNGDLKTVPIERHPWIDNSRTISVPSDWTTCGYRYGKVSCDGTTYAIIYTSLETPRPNPTQDQRSVCIQGWGWGEGAPNDLGYAVYLTQ